MSSTIAAININSASPTPTQSSDPRWRFGPPAPISDENATKYLNLFLFFVFAIFAIASLPRALVRCRTGPTGGWKQGWLLKNAIPGQPKQTRYRRVGDNGPSRQNSSKSARSDRTKVTNGEEEEGSAETHTTRVNYNGDIVSIHTLKKASGPAPQAFSGPPANVPSWSSLFFPVSKWMAKTIYGYSIGRLFLYALYAATFFVCLLYYADPTKNVRRSGWICVSQYPFIMLLASKNNAVGVCLGVGYEKLNYLHRWIGKFMFIASLFHVVGYLVIWTKRGTLTLNSAAEGPGWIAFGGLCFLACLSVPVFRRSAYTVFIYSHHAGYLIMFVAICFHIKSAIPWSAAAGVIMGFDHFVRFIKTHYVTAHIYAVPEIGCTRIEVPSLTKGWKAGQHVRIRAISYKLGLISCFEAHPFTIASVAELPACGGGQGLVLYCKKAGDWTQRLYNAAEQYHQIIEVDEKGRKNAGHGYGNTMKLFIEGPYGGTGHALFSSFSAAFIVTGGSGITFGVSTVEELLRDVECGAARTRLIHLVWVVQEHSSLVPFLSKFNQLIKRASRLPSVRMKIGIHYTQASRLTPATNRIGPNGQILHRNVSTKSAEERRLTVEYDLPIGIHLRAGRPKLDVLSDALVEKTSTLNTVVAQRASVNVTFGMSGIVERCGEGPSGIIFAACGPLGLAEDVKKTALNISRDARHSVGGVEYFEETFGW